MQTQKTTIALLLLLAFGYNQLQGQSKYSGQHFMIMVFNDTEFDLHATPLPDEGQGYFMRYTSTLKSRKAFQYECENPNALKGVEGHLRFTVVDGGVPGFVDIYFDNPAVGSASYDVKTDWPFAITHKLPFAEKRNPNLWIVITADTANHGSANSGHVKTKPAPPALFGDEPIPDVIQFDWQVTQRMKKVEDEDDDDDRNGKAYRMITYFFTTSGDYAAVKPEDKSFSLMIYSKKGHTWLIDDKTKTITVMMLPKIVGEGAMMAKQMAEGIKRSPLQKDRDDEPVTITKTGKTKKVLGYTAMEYEMKSRKGVTTNNTSKTGTASFWYIKAPFDPVKIYTMGVGRPADISKLQNDPHMKNNITAIPVLNQNYLWVETESGNIKGMETTEIKNVFNTIRTAGYKIKKIGGLKDGVTKDK